jgi:predicted metal-dependent enzyme (double-stranded beta helix superfamily)
MEMKMETNGYSILNLVTDLRRVVSKATDERDILSQIRPLAQRAALSKDSWLEKRFYAANPEQGFGVYLLHEEPDHSLAIFAVSWLPNRGAPPHDHGTWAVVAGVDGPEKNEFFERLDDRSRAGYAELKKVGEKVFRVGDVLTMRTGQVHSIWNEGDTVSISLHIYGKNIQHTGRSQFDVEKRIETPFILKLET